MWGIFFSSPRNFIEQERKKANLFRFEVLGMPFVRKYKLKVVSTNFSHLELVSIEELVFALKYWKNFARKN